MNSYLSRRIGQIRRADLAGEAESNRLIKGRDATALVSLTSTGLRATIRRAFTSRDDGLSEFLPRLMNDPTARS